MTALPLPTVAAAWPQAVPTTLTRCALLALLLHLWLALTLGSAPGGTARRGEGVWGAINVTLRGPARAGPAQPVLPPAPVVIPTGPAGPALSPRSGGAVRAAGPMPTAEAGAAKLADWAATPAAPPDLPPDVPPPTAPLPTPQAAPSPPPPPGRVLQERWLPPTLPERELPTPALSPAATPQAVSPVLPAVPAPLATAPRAAAEAVPEPAPAPLREPAPVPMPAVRRLDAGMPTPPAAVPPLPLSPALAATVPLPRAPLVVGVPLPGAVPGLPDAGAQVGHDVATPPSAPASVPPRLNLELARPRGGELSRHSTTGVMQLLPRPPDLPAKLAREIDKAAKPDCRTAYGGAGLLAVVPLVADAVRKEGGCKW